MTSGDILTAAQMRGLVDAAGAGWLTINGASEPYSSDDLTDDLSFQALGGNEFRVVGTEAIITIRSDY